MNSTYELIKEASLFKDLPPEALEELSRLCHERSVEESSFFFMQGDEARHMYVLTRGRVKLTQVTPDGQQVILGMVVPGQMFAGIAILNPQKGYPVSGAVMVEFKVEYPGNYVLVDHALARLDRGAWGVLHVTGEADPAIYDGVIESGHGH